MFSNRRAAAPNPDLVKPETLLFEYAVYTKDQSFINTIRNVVSGMIVSQKTFACCQRGSSREGFPTGLTNSETDDSSPADQAGLVQTAQEVIKKLLGDHLHHSKVASDVIESVMECTFA